MLFTYNLLFIKNYQLFIENFLMELTLGLMR